MARIQDRMSSSVSACNMYTRRLGLMISKQLRMSIDMHSRTVHSITDTTN